MMDQCWLPVWWCPWFWLRPKGTSRRELCMGVFVIGQIVFIDLKLNLVGRGDWVEADQTGWSCFVWGWRLESWVNGGHIRDGCVPGWLVVEGSKGELWTTKKRQRGIVRTWCLRPCLWAETEPECRVVMQWARRSEVRANVQKWSAVQPNEDFKFKCWCGSEIRRDNCPKDNLMKFILLL